MYKNKKNIFLSRHLRAKRLVAALAQATIILSHPTLAQNNQSSPLSREASVSLEWNQAKDMYIAIGDALVEQDDKSLKADKIIARYDSSSKDRDLTDISASGSVVFIDGENVARGSKLNYRIGDEAYDLFGPNAIVTSPRGIMTAAGSIAYTTSNTDEKQVIAIGAASYKDNNGRVIEGTKVVAFLDVDGTIKNISANGNAKVVTPKGIITTADRLNYFSATDRADLFGNVEIINNENIMRGARAEVEFNKEISRLLSDNTGKRVTGVLH